MLQERHKGMVVVQGTPLCFDLHFKDINKHVALADATIFAASLSNLWRNHALYKSIL